MPEPAAGPYRPFVLALSVGAAFPLGAWLVGLATGWGWVLPVVVIAVLALDMMWVAALVAPGSLYGRSRRLNRPLERLGRDGGPSGWLRALALVLCFGAPSLVALLLAALFS